MSTKGCPQPDATHCNQAKISVLTANIAMDFRSEGPLSGVPPTLVGEDDEQEGERRQQRRRQGSHEGISDIGE